MRESRDALGACPWARRYIRPEILVRSALPRTSTFVCSDSTLAPCRGINVPCCAAPTTTTKSLPWALPIFHHALEHRAAGDPCTGVRHHLRPPELFQLIRSPCPDSAGDNPGRTSEKAASSLNSIHLSGCRQSLGGDVVARTPMSLGAAQPSKEFATLGNSFEVLAFPKRVCADRGLSSSQISSPPSSGVCHGHGMDYDSFTFNDTVEDGCH